LLGRDGFNCSLCKIERICASIAPSTPGDKTWRREAGSTQTADDLADPPDSSGAVKDIPLVATPYLPGAQEVALDLIQFHVERARKDVREILEYASFLDADAIMYLTRLEHPGALFWSFDSAYTNYQRGGLGNTDLSFLARPIYNYLRLLDLLSQYQGKYLAASVNDQMTVFEWMKQDDGVPFGPRHNRPRMTK
jgi:hypothetical protein